MVMLTFLWPETEMVLSEAAMFGVIRLKLCRFAIFLQ